MIKYELGDIVTISGKQYKVCQGVCSFFNCPFFKDSCNLIFNGKSCIETIGYDTHLEIVSSESKVEPIVFKRPKLKLKFTL